jgi:peptidoglycan/LPS O-acetylase OafA/YrhL
MLYHAKVIFEIQGPFSRGYLFVDFFFLLSGFVLTLATRDRFCVRGEATKFVFERMKRLWPLSAVGTSLGAAISLILSGPEGGAYHIALGLLMIPAFIGQGQLFPLNGPQWSLFFELMINVLHAMVLRRLNDPQLRLALLASALGLGLMIMRFGSNTVGPFAFNWQWALPRVAFSYLFGMWFARRWMARPPVAILNWTSALILPVTCVVVLPSLPLALGIGDMLATIVLMPTLFWVAACAVVPPGAEKWLKRIGALSFPLYAIHLPILELFAHFDKGPVPFVFAIVTSILGAFLLGRPVFKMAWTQPPQPTFSA